MNDSVMLKRTLEDGADKLLGMAKVVEFLERVKEGDIILIDNLTREGCVDKTCIGRFKTAIYEPDEIFFSGSNYIIEGIGIPIEFEEKKCKQFYVTGEVPDDIIIRVRDYKKLHPHFAELKSLIGVAHYNSTLLSGKNSIDTRLKKYNSSFDAFLDSLK